MPMAPNRVALTVLLSLLLATPAPAHAQRLRYLGTARQLGPVAYRDPLGVPSPDGRWLATHVGLRLRIGPLVGGPTRELGEGRRRRLFLAWRPDSAHLVAREANRERSWFDWFEYDIASGRRAPLWGDHEMFVPPTGDPAERRDLLELAFAPDGTSAGVVARGRRREVWTLDGAGRVTAVQLTHFSRDSYAPYALADGRILFKLQHYAVTIARVAAAGGDPVPVTTFQSETPSWDWAGERIAFTYGSWRRVIDDAGYPDIAQHVGWVRPSEGIADEPRHTVRRSYSEDQGMHWSPNGRWIVLHSHADGTDDIWLQPADGATEAVPITRGGNETGRPRFSPDGRWIVYPTDYRGPDGDLLGYLQIVGFDPEAGTVTQPQRRIDLVDFDGQANFAEFGPDSRTLWFEAMHDVGQRAIWRVDREGGRPELVHRFASEQWFTGISVSPDGAWVAYVAPARDGRMQLFKVPSASGEPVQVTFDPSDKTHPSWSPRGDQIAFTVFEYLAHFWLLQR